MRGYQQVARCDSKAPGLNEAPHSKPPRLSSDYTSQRWGIFIRFVFVNAASGGE